ncbi:hypothetical protein [Alteromonas gracilis]|uniref:hypothetical protein n=1 Tax=Alteromonas gracilis TaxID=1479524 RepID=UPI0030CE6690
MAAQQRLARRSMPTGPVTAAYERKIDAGEVRLDNAQIALAAKLDALHQSLTSLPPVPVRTYKGEDSSATSSNPLSLLLQRGLWNLPSPFFKRSSIRGLWVHHHKECTFMARSGSVRAF